MRIRVNKAWLFIIIFSFYANYSVAAETVNNDTEVVVIATQHFIGDMPEGYTPAHLRALLNKVSADVLAVEAPANCADPWSWAPLDLWQITKPWADQRKIKTIPVGWNEPRYPEQLQQMFQEYERKGITAEYQEIEQNFQVISAQQENTCENMNSAAANELWRNYHAELHRLYGKDTPWEDWNKIILANIIKLCRQYRGKRVAVVFGGAHSYYFIDHLADQDGIRLLVAEDFFPLTAEEVQQQVVPTDYLRALRLLNYNPGAVPAENMSKMKACLDKIKNIDRMQNDYHLFSGKYLLHSLQPQEALVEFKKVAALNAEAISLFDNQSRLKEVGLVYCALAQIQMREYSAARAELEKITNLPEVTPSTKQWARQIIDSIAGY